jgi:hypothetical protein
MLPKLFVGIFKRHGSIARAALLGLMLGFLAPSTSAQSVVSGDQFWYFPDGIVAYWAVDPRPLGSGSQRATALGAATLRGVIEHTVNIEGTSSVEDNLLRGKILGDAPYRVCLVELVGESTIPKDKRADTTVKPSNFGAVIEIRAPAKDGGHDRLEAAIEAALADDIRAEGGKPRDRKRITLPGGFAQVSSPGPDAWREVTWMSAPEAFYVGFGHGVLEKWLNAKATPSRNTPWFGQRTTVVAKRGRGTRIFEAFVDLNALRTGIPEEFGAGRIGKLLHSWHIANARTFMFHATLMNEAQEQTQKFEGVPLLALDVSWSSRSEKPGQWKTLALTEGTWPEKLTGVSRPTTGSWAVLARANLPTWIDIGASTYEDLGGGTEFAAICSRWERRMTPALDKIVPRIGEWVLVAPDQVVVGVRPADGGAGQDRLAFELRGLFSSMEPYVGFATKTWSLKGEGDAELKGFGWRLGDDGKAILGGWDFEKPKQKK